jgi:hypothetical protein
MGSPNLNTSFKRHAWSLSTRVTIKNVANNGQTVLERVDTVMRLLARAHKVPKILREAFSPALTEWFTFHDTHRLATINDENRLLELGPLGYKLADINSLEQVFRAVLVASHNSVGQREATQMGLWDL